MGSLKYVIILPPNLQHQHQFKWIKLDIYYSLHIHTPQNPDSDGVQVNHHERFYPVGWPVTRQGKGGNLGDRGRRNWLDKRDFKCVKYWMHTQGLQYVHGLTHLVERTGPVIRGVSLKDLTPRSRWWRLWFATNVSCHFDRVQECVDDKRAFHRVRLWK